MKAYNIADLEAQLTDQGWRIVATEFVVPHEIPGQVHDGGYRVVLTPPNAGDAFTASDPTRTDAFRAAAVGAGLIEDDQPNLM